MSHEQLKIQSLTKQVEDLRTSQEASIALLKQCVPHLGMIAGENVLQHIADLTGGYFSSKEFNYEKPNGEQ